MNFVTFSKPVPKHIFKARATLPLNADAEQSFIRPKLQALDML